jgi:putative transposase
MLHAYVKMFIHVVWATKEREKLLTKEAQTALQSHFVKYAGENDIQLDALSVQSDHVHILLNLMSDQRVGDIVKLLKGESSHWINERDLIAKKFSWQRGYGAFSISPSHYQIVKTYIMDQDEHHRKKAFVDEYRAILRKYSFSFIETDESVQTEASNL